MRLIVSLTIMLLLWMPVSAQVELGFGQVWKSHSNEPLINTVGEPETWNDGNEFWDWNWGHVLQDADTFKLYIGASDGLHYSIGMYYSTDLDSGWTEYENNPVLERTEGAWDAAHVGGPIVIKDGDTYKMWYTGTHHLPTHGDNKTIGYAVSTDGVTWDKHPDPVVDPTQFVQGSSYTWVRNPFVIQEADTFKMWVGISRVSPTYEFLQYGYSLDGINWTFPSEEPVLAPLTNHYLLTPLVRKVGNYYYMWALEGRYAANWPSSTILARSADGMNWERDQLYNPVLKRGSGGPWDQYGAVVYDVFETADGFTALYGGWGDEIHNHVGLAKFNPTLISGGDVSGTWTEAESPYLIEGDIRIPNGETLTIDAGTTIEFLGHYKMDVQGQIIATGSEAEPIRFWVDDTLGFYDDASTTGVWGGIKFDSVDPSNATSSLEFCDFRFGKHFNTLGSWTGGGAILINNTDSVSVSNSTFRHNRTIRNQVSSVAIGGAIGITARSSPYILNCTFEYNYANHLHSNKNAGGGAIAVNDRSHPLIRGNVMKHNWGTDVGGAIAIMNYSDPILVNNLICENSIVSHNGLEGYGGGIGLYYRSHPKLINNTIANNEAGWGGGGVYFNEASATFINTIIADNVRLNAPADAQGHQMAYITSSSMAGEEVNLYYSCLEGGINKIRNYLPGTMNASHWFDNDPSLTGNYSLSYSSLLLGAGTSSCEVDGQTYTAPNCDCTGEARPQPAGSNPDMGALEYMLGAHIIMDQWSWYEYLGNPILESGPPGSWDDDWVQSPDVIYHDGLYKMWYTGADDYRRRIGYATSPDGFSWTKHDGFLLESAPSTWMDNHLNYQRVVLADSVFHMWFWSADRIGHATSSDGINWTFTENAVLWGDNGQWDQSMVVPADIIYDGAEFQMWYNGSSDGDVIAVGYATSPDGINWTKYDGNPVFERGAPGSWDDDGLFYASSVVYNGGQYILWYCGNDGITRNRIGRATSVNGINWTRNTPDAPEIPASGINGTWNEGATFLPAVIIDQGMYKMWFTGATDAGYDGPAAIGFTHLAFTDIDEVSSEVQPDVYSLSQNYPNPFNPVTHIRFTLPEHGDIRLVVYDVLGREIVTLVDGYQTRGAYEATWYGLDNHGQSVPTGLYFARLEAGAYTDVIKMLYLK